MTNPERLGHIAPGTKGAREGTEFLFKGFFKWYFETHETVAPDVAEGKDNRSKLTAEVQEWREEGKEAEALRDARRCPGEWQKPLILMPILHEIRRVI